MPNMTVVTSQDRKKIARYLPPARSRALSRYLISVGPSNGLMRKQIAPASNARLRMLSSGKAVMKITGTSRRAKMSFTASGLDRRYQNCGSA